MKHDPVSGPIPREKFNALVTAPHGEARDIIRQYDPFWGLAPDAKIEFEVEVSAEVTGYAIVKASSLEEAKKLAEKLTADDVEFDTYEMKHPCNWTVDSVEPVKPPVKHKEPAR